MFWALVRLGLGRCEDLRTLLTSALSSSASCWLSLVQAASMAVMYSKLGGCLEVTAKLGPLARTDLCTGVKGLLERLMTHLGLGSSLEEPWLELLGGWRWDCLPWRLHRPPGKVLWVVALGVPSALPTCPGGLLPCPDWGELEDWGLLAWEELFSSLVGVELADRGELLPSGGRCTAPGRELLPLPGGKVSNGRCMDGR